MRSKVLSGRNLLAALVALLMAFACSGAFAQYDLMPFEDDPVAISAAFGAEQALLRLQAADALYAEGVAEGVAEDDIQELLEGLELDRVRFAAALQRNARDPTPNPRAALGCRLPRHPPRHPPRREHRRPAGATTPVPPRTPPKWRPDHPRTASNRTARKHHYTQTPSATRPAPPAGFGQTEPYSASGTRPITTLCAPRPTATLSTTHKHSVSITDTLSDNPFAEYTVLPVSYTHLTLP